MTTVIPVFNQSADQVIDAFCIETLVDARIEGNWATVVSRSSHRADVATGKKRSTPFEVFPHNDHAGRAIRRWLDQRQAR